MKRTIEFLDKNRNKVTAECEITTRNGYEEFTMSGDYGGSCGQIFDSITPDGEYQEKLIDIWKQRHLKKIGEGFEDILDSVLDKIEEEELEKQERPVEESDIDLFEEKFSDPKCALALAMMFDLCINEIDDIVEESNNRWTVQGIDYLAGTDDEMDVAWDESLDSYLEECVYPDLPEALRNYFDDEKWKKDAKMDGRAHSLNHWDSSELDWHIDGKWYYAYRQ